MGRVANVHVSLIGDCHAGQLGGTHTDQVEASPEFGVFYIFNSLASVQFQWNLIEVILKIILSIDGWGIFCEIALRWMSLDLIED